MTLEAKLQKLIELWWKPFGSSRGNQIKWTGLANLYIYTDWRQDEQKVTLNDLCSIDSGLRQFVCDKSLYKDNHDSIVRNYFDGDWNDDNSLYEIFNERYRLMLSSIQENKEKFLLDNISLPT